MKLHGRTLKQDFKMVLRGIKEFNVMLPGQLKLITVNSVLNCLIPYTALIFSALLITELTGDKNIVKLVTYALLTITVTLLLTAVTSRFKTKIEAGYSLLFRAHEIHLDSKAYELEYAQLEDPYIRTLREQVSGSISTSGAGMASLYWDIEVVVTNLSSVIIAIILFFNIYTGSSYKGFTGIFMLVNSPWSALILAVLVFICAALSSKIAGKFFNVSFEVFLHGAKYSRYAGFYEHEYLYDDKAAKDVRIFNQRDLIIRETQEQGYIPLYEGSKRELKAEIKYNGLKVGMSAVLGGLVYLFVGLKALSGTVGLGSVVMVYGAVTKLILSLADLSQIITDLRNNNEHLKRYFEFMDIPSQNESGTEAVELTGENIIRFENVSFKYPGSETYTLKNINLELGGSGRLAVVGMNGSGKTTMIKLLCRLYKPTEGRITLNGIDISCYKYEKYIRLFSVVFQDFKLLAFPLGQNVAAKAEYNESKVRDCLELAGFGVRLSELTKGTEQALYRDFEEDGVNLSGGEEQKIAIARAIYKDGPFVILDEPTAALDPGFRI